VDFGAIGGQRDCEPYRPVPVPLGADSILAAALKDRNVTCAVFKDAVLAVYGPDLAPLGWGQHCFFVEPTHTFSITADLDSSYPPSDYGTDPSLYVERQITQFASKQSVSFWNSRKSEYDIYLSPSNDINHQGMVHIQAEAFPPRGELGVTQPNVDMAKMRKVEQVVSQVAQHYFS
jgi:hypothetical protein